MRKRDTARLRVTDIGHVINISDGFIVRHFHTFLTFLSVSDCKKRIDNMPRGIVLIYCRRNTKTSSMFERKIASAKK